MKAVPIFAKGVSRHTCQKAARRWAARANRNRPPAGHHLLYAFRDTLADMGNHTATAPAPGGVR